MTNIIDRLIDTHGEDPPCPTRADWTAIFSLGEDEPVHIINLLKFHEHAESTDGQISGAEAYGRYSTSVGEAFVRHGGQLIFSGTVGHLFHLNAPGEWDAAVMTRYPSPGALADFWLDPTFVAGHEHRLDGLAKSQVILFGS